MKLVSTLSGEFILTSEHFIEFTDFSLRNVSQLLSKFDGFKLFVSMSELDGVSELGKWVVIKGVNTFRQFRFGSLKAEEVLSDGRVPFVKETLCVLNW